MTTILLVGGGRMGGALARGWRQRGIAPESIFAVEPDPASAARLRTDTGATVVAAPGVLRTKPDVVVFAVKPQGLAEIASAYRAFTDSVFLSIAAGRTLKFFAGALGPRAAFIEPLDLKFAGSSATEVAKSKTALEAKLTSCFDAHVSKDLSFSTRIFVAADGRITKAEDLQVCKEQHPGFYLCTERVNAAKPKSGFPTVPESVFACFERALVSSRLPRVTVDPGESTTHSDIHVQVR